MNGASASSAQGNLTKGTINSANDCSLQVVADQPQVSFERDKEQIVTDAALAGTWPRGSINLKVIVGGRVDVLHGQEGDNAGGSNCKDEGGELQN